MDKVNMDNYYRIRKEIRKMYRDPSVNSDIYSRVFEVRDKYTKYISSMSIDISSYEINIGFEDGTEQDKKIEIESKIINRIGACIVDHVLQDPVLSKDEAFNDFINSDIPLFCDIISVGNSERINL